MASGIYMHVELNDLLRVMRKRREQTAGFLQTQSALRNSQELELKIEIWNTVITGLQDLKQHNEHYLQIEMMIPRDLMRILETEGGPHIPA